jgi:hypothetical protein
MASLSEMGFFSPLGSWRCWKGKPESEGIYIEARE